MDRSSYFISFANAEDRFNNLELLSSSIVFQEPLYIVIVYFLSIFFSPQAIAIIIISFASSSSIFSLYKARPELLLIIILVFLLPQMMGKYIVHLRQGLAIAFFLTIFLYFKKNLFISSFIAGLIHISFFAVIPIMILIRLTPKNRNAILITSIALSIFTFIFFSQGLFAKLVFFLDLRQANNYLFESNNISGLGFLYWSVIYMIFFFQKKISESRTLSMNIIALYCTSYFWLNFISRILEAFIPLIFLELKLLNTYICYLALIFYLFISWQTRLQLPLYGFG
jgi:hypothetical protein